MEKSVGGGENLTLVNNKLLSIPAKDENLKPRKLSKMDTLISFLEIKKGDESIEAFWHSINDMKTFYFGLAVWCIGWNLAAVYISPTKWIQFIPLILLGIFFGFSGFHCRYVYSIQKFKHVSFLLLFAAVYVFGAIIIFRDLMVSFLIHFPSFPEISFKKAPEKIMNLGNIGLLFVAILCNCAVFKKIGEQIGIEIDALHKEIKELKSKQDLTVPQVTPESGVIRRQISKPSLQQQISIPFGGSGIEQKINNINEQ